jgi:hypothetical protein
MVRNHQPGEAVFRSILPEDIDWLIFAMFAPLPECGHCLRVGDNTPLCNNEP